MAVITIICFKTYNVRQFIRNCLFTYLISTVIGGICFYIYYLFRLKYFSFVLLIASSFVFFIIVKLFVGLIDVYIIDRKKYCEIDVGINGRSYSLTAIIDTGAYLKDEISGHTVIIAEEKVFGNLDEYKKTFIPFRSLGNDEGVLPAVYGQWAIINKKIIKPVIIGVYDKKLSDSFNAIISPEAIGGYYENI